MSTSRAPVLNQRCLNPVPCSGGAGGLHSTREAAAGKGRAISWLQELNTKGPTRYLNKLIKQICFLPLFRTDCTVQDKEMTLVPVSRMTWMYNLIWLVGKAESQGQARLGAQNLLDSKPEHYTWCKPTSASKAGSLGKQEHTLCEGSLNAEQELLVCLVRCQFTNCGNIFLSPSCWIYPKRSQIVWISEVLRCAQHWAQLPASQ